MKRPSWSVAAIVQLIVLNAAFTAWVRTPGTERHELLASASGRRLPMAIDLPRAKPLVIEPFYDDPSVVSDADLRAVLRKLQPRFEKTKLRPNAVEHALRAWSIDAEFSDPKALSGRELADVLLDHGKYLASWGADAKPILEDVADGVSVRWGAANETSVHHDHWLASLTEAGVSIDEPVFTPNRNHRTIRDVLTQAVADFRLDETEVEWSALAFGLWLPPQKEWTGRDGRIVSFDLLAERLIRGHQRTGVCLGTHRVYSLMALVRLDDEFAILSVPVRKKTLDHLAYVRDLIAASQYEDGRWPTNWAIGVDARKSIESAELYRQVIATGHHLEWLAIAPLELHPPREQVRRAATWVIQTTLAQTDAEIERQYTFYSHVANALALWRKTHPRPALSALGK